MRLIKVVKAKTPERTGAWCMTACPQGKPEKSRVKSSRLTREALPDVDTGSVIDHQAVQARADSLSADTPLPVPR